jgi:hypothetical protein
MANVMSFAFEAGTATLAQLADKTGTEFGLGAQRRGRLPWSSSEPPVVMLITALQDFLDARQELQDTRIGRGTPVLEVVGVKIDDRGAGLCRLDGGLRNLVAT